MKIEFPEIRKDRFTKDFSWGFYCTKFKEETEKVSSYLYTSIVNVYEIKDIKSLNIKKFEYCTDEWLKLLYNH